jgi:carbon-monoxide dehydrogenase medium subunit
VCALVALHAAVRLASYTTERRLAVTEFLLGPGRNAARPDELIVAVSFPKPQGRYGSNFIKLGRRKALALAVVAVGASLELDEAGCVRRCGIALGSVGPTTLEARQAEALLVGQALSPELIEQAAARAGEEASPISDVRGSAKYRKDMVPVLVRRALQASWEQAQAQAEARD